MLRSHHHHYLRAFFKSLKAELNPICHLLALLGAHHIFDVSGLRVKLSLVGCMLREWIYR